MDPNLSDPSSNTSEISTGTANTGGGYLASKAEVGHMPEIMTNGDEKQEDGSDATRPMKRKKTPKERKTKTARENDRVMGTNDSSIESKRSVEAYYRPKPHFYHLFTPHARPRRRSPLIHRGYWFRMYCISRTVKNFLALHPGRRTAIVNLGCGYDPLPFQMLSSDRPMCEHTKFVDVDFPELIETKCRIVREKTECRGLLTMLQPKPTEQSVVRLESEEYVAIGCDLGDGSRFAQALEAVVDRSAAVLVIGEVSVAYMDVDKADGLIEYFGRWPNAQLCLLEQILPHGPDHPFARQMLSHLERNGSALKSVYRYPTVHDQMERFRARGWRSCIQARSLWRLWSDDTFISPAERKALNAVEMFDEWEEFALFAAHYAVTVAASDLFSSTQRPVNSVSGAYIDANIASPRDKDEYEVEVTAKDELEYRRERHLTEEANQRRDVDMHSNTKNPSATDIDAIAAEDARIGYVDQIASLDTLRSHAAVIATSGCIIQYAGYGQNGRESSTSVYPTGPNEESMQISVPGDLKGRMCHTITQFKDSWLLVGGRTSPNEPLVDCWQYQHQEWKRIPDLPFALYRHSAVATRYGVLIFGGRFVDGGSSNLWLLFNGKRWKNLGCCEPKVEGRFGSIFAADTAGISGILAGGMAEDGVVIGDYYRWRIEPKNGELFLNITFRSTQISRDAVEALCRMGAKANLIDSVLTVVGGVTLHGLPGRHQDVVQIQVDGNDAEGISTEARLRYVTRSDSSGGLPLLVGHDVVWRDTGIVILGGGANCFSFGSVFNPGVYRLRFEPDTATTAWPTASTLIPARSKSQKYNSSKASHPSENNKLESRPEVGVVQELPEQHDAGERFQQLVQIDREARVLRNRKIGESVQSWKPEYLKAKIGGDREVTVHETEEDNMSFQTKNFRYAHKSFAAFINAIVAGKKEYLRSLGKDDGKRIPANIVKDFPELADDLEVPEELHYVTDNLHSSVLRISGPVSMWLHYDVMANVLFQIRGTKTLMLFPPSDISKLQIPPGESSSAIADVEQALLNGTLAGTHPQKVDLTPGDILYIPPLWSHTATPTKGISVAVNMFFRDAAPTVYAHGRDVYANRDVQAYEDGRRDLARVKDSVARLMNRFNDVPADMAIAYRARLYSELMSNLTTLREKYQLGP